ncbi:MAG: hypothetical protein ACM3YO_02710 [Bacteroidota bacterium]
MSDVRIDTTGKIPFKPLGPKTDQAPEPFGPKAPVEGDRLVLSTKTEIPETDLVQKAKDALLELADEHPVATGVAATGALLAVGAAAKKKGGVEFDAGYAVYEDSELTVKVGGKLKLLGEKAVELKSVEISVNYTF